MFTPCDCLIQAGKRDKEQPSIAAVLRAADPTKLADVVVVGAGPSGLCLAAELAKRGLNVVIVGEWLGRGRIIPTSHLAACPTYVPRLHLLQNGKREKGWEEAVRVWIMDCEFSPKRSDGIPLLHF